ncbi:MAG: DUF123 domain-containing protein, partial [Candidatus Thorarchaeota archaeon]
VLIIRVRTPVAIQIKSIGEVAFDSGLWLYVGSAMGTGSTNLENRLHRHFRKEKTVYWHIDHLLESNVEIVEAIWSESPESAECLIAKAIEAHDDFSPGPRAFGSSDCKNGCLAHVFIHKGNDQIQDTLFMIFRQQGLQPRVTKTGLL